MAGHSKWANIRHRKGAQDAKRGKIFTKVAKEITIAARNGGDPEMNPALRLALQKAKGVNMPNDNIQRAIKRGTGEIEGVSYEAVTYEGYAPGGIAVLVESLTDNKNRTVAEVRHIFSKRGGSLGESGCVAYMFDRKGIITINSDAASEDDVMMVALESGAEDVKNADGIFEVLTAATDFMAVRDAVEEAGIPIETANFSMVPATTIAIEDEKTASQVLNLMEALEDSDEVQDVYMNFDIDNELMERLDA
ncbi:YebC/PmpR family DNA-binding transcriptional regulator [Desulfurispira natronophila]|uniref:Probable transcriptional regulatory protein HNR37_002003 n=1 Tax=Desulfurispira natronophila TaxID=682562 RepID=A0A7W8DHP2_9BACT|nr:YebC/PmpR family DNA-binding transcriptional regulator [Desulfurispira natronophila]MBB5022664.1 YebC/PmpR family DNA-binding regulatory protein [Desulfurispira natronophila]